MLIYKVNCFNNIDINTVPIVVLNIISSSVSPFISYANKGKINASEAHVNKPNNLNMATN